MNNSTPIELSVPSKLPVRQPKATNLSLGSTWAPAQLLLQQALACGLQVPGDDRFQEGRPSLENIKLIKGYGCMKCMMMYELIRFGSVP